MWLINARTLKLEHAIDPEESNMKYAILSHTWEHEEVTFQQFQNLEQARRMAGFTKIQSTCTLARNQGLDYVWVDTCCIDKSSSAELSEAINSMFSYYQLADTCYAYLSDMPDVGIDDLRPLEESDPILEKAIRASKVFQALCKCRWFTRGWTLQELIAPSDVKFYDSSWNLIGKKTTISFVLSLITYIDNEVLLSNTDLLSIPACARMSWAANRETTRVEDIAYCLLGIFDVNLPLIYGEGYKAFQRLQEEIVRTSGDVTILAWSSRNITPRKYLPTPYKNSRTPKFRGPFAWSPSEFAGNSSFGQLDPLKSTRIGINVVNGAVEISATGDLALRDLDDNGQLHLAIPGSDEHDCRIMMTPLGYAMISHGELQEESSLREHIYWRSIVPHRPTSTLRIISHQDAMRLNRMNLVLEPYLLRFDDIGLKNIAPRTGMMAWPARYFDPRGQAFVFARPDIYPTQPVHILGLVAFPISITFFRKGHKFTQKLDFIFCCGAFTCDPQNRRIESWSITFCKQSTDWRSRSIYDWLEAGMDEHMTEASYRYKQDNLWDDTRRESPVPSFRASIAMKVSLHYENEAHMALSKSLIGFLEHKTENIQNPDDDDHLDVQRSLLQYTTSRSSKPSYDGSGTISKFSIRFSHTERKTSLAWNAEETFAWQAF